MTTTTPRLPLLSYLHFASSRRQMLHSFLSALVLFAPALPIYSYAGKPEEIQHVLDCAVRPCESSPPRIVLQHPNFPVPSPPIATVEERLHSNKNPATLYLPPPQLELLRNAVSTTTTPPAPAGSGIPPRQLSGPRFSSSFDIQTVTETRVTNHSILTMLPPPRIEKQNSSDTRTLLPPPVAPSDGASAADCLYFYCDLPHTTAAVSSMLIPVTIIPITTAPSNVMGMDLEASAVHRSGNPLVPQQPRQEASSPGEQSAPPTPQNTPTPVLFSIEHDSREAGLLSSLASLPTTSGFTLTGSIETSAFSTWGQPYLVNPLADDESDTTTMITPTSSPPSSLSRGTQAASEQFQKMTKSISSKLISSLSNSVPSTTAITDSSPAQYCQYRDGDLNTGSCIAASHRSNPPQFLPSQFYISDAAMTGSLHHVLPAVTQTPTQQSTLATTVTTTPSIRTVTICMTTTVLL